MSKGPALPGESQESDLLVAFEAQNIPGPYKEYYKTKRNNFFASVRGFPEMWEYYIRLDKIWLREFADVRPQGEADLAFPLILYFNSHAKIRVSIELALSGCLAEARSILRDAIEFVAHAHSMIEDPSLQEVWLSKNEEEEAFTEAFERRKKEGLFKGLEELHAKWGQLSEIGSHATPKSLCDRFATVELKDGTREWRFNYCSVEPRLWGMSLFSLLLTCFEMERTFFADYEDRLMLDPELVQMRAEFERYKESLRETLKMRYDVKPPSPKSLIQTP